MMLKPDSPYYRKESNNFDIGKRYRDYAKVYATPEGQRMIEDLLYYASINRTAFCMKADNQTFFNLGKQSLGYHIYNVLTQEPTTLNNNYGDRND